MSGNELVVTAKVEESDVVSQHVEPEEISDDEIHLPESKPADFQNDAPVQDNELSDAERIQQEIAATLVQAAFRGYLVIFSPIWI